MTLATYTIGPPRRPNITHDNGFLDQFARRAPTARDHVQYSYWQAKLEGAEAIQGVPFMPHNDLPDALACYRHFLDGSGATRTINYERYVQHDSSGRTTIRSVIIEAKGAAYLLYNSAPAGNRAAFTFTGSVLSASNSNTNFPYPATENWQKAIGAHQFWISGDVTASQSGGQTAFDLTFTMHVEDMYNFNPGAADIATGIPDAANGVFEITGLARQYLNVAELSRRVQWNGSPGGTLHTVTTAPTSRQRQPGDNRRARNRI